MNNDKFNIVNDTFCILPWLHMHTWPDGKVYQCCITGWDKSYGNLNDSTMEELWNGEYMKTLRTDMLQNKRPVSCSKCYEQEDMGTVSFRQSSNAQFYEHSDRLVEKTHDSGHLNEFILRYWDFRFSNLCNMKCRMCGDLLSSLWAEESIKRFGGNSFTNFKTDSKNRTTVMNNAEIGVDLYKYIDMFIDHVEEIYFAGGEPLIMKEHYYILEKLIQRGRTDVRIRYNTNLSKLQMYGYDCLELWKHFDHVNIIASIDATGTRGEYIRKGTVWKSVENNLRRIASEPGLIVGVSPTINLFNIWHIPDFVDFLVDVGVDNIHLNNVLTTPEWFHINTLPEKFKEKVVIKYDNHLARVDDLTKSKIESAYAYILNYMAHNPENLEKLRTQFKSVTENLDIYRDEKFELVCPELSDYYRGI